MPRLRTAAPLPTLIPALLAAALLPAVPAARAAEPTGDLRVHALANGTVRAEVAERIGGRLVAFGLAGRPSFLRFDAAAGAAEPRVDAYADNIGYLGHEVWVGPQKQWWVHQRVNAQRAAAAANWPPDPWLGLSNTVVVEDSPTALALRGPASPVSGVALEKRYALVAGRPNSLRLDVRAINRRDTRVAWDIWFNTRAHADTAVYVPVASRGDVRVEAAQKDRPVPAFTLERGLFALDVPAPEAPDAAHKGKVFLQPSGGWLAGFRAGQVLVIQFPHQPRSAIHPDQGQVELYHDVVPGQADEGVLEMEVHAPYRRLAPRAAMAAHELWTILPYDGPATRAGHVAFLRAHARELGLDGI
nr:DUF4380 domain-containing protein [uncultured Massilia sp.]